MLPLTSPSVLVSLVLAAEVLCSSQYFVNCTSTPPRLPFYSSILSISHSSLVLAALSLPQALAGAHAPFVPFSSTRHLSLNHNNTFVDPKIACPQRRSQKRPVCTHAKPQYFDSSGALILPYRDLIVVSSSASGSNLFSELSLPSRLRLWLNLIRASFCV